MRLNPGKLGGSERLVGGRASVGLGDRAWAGKNHAP